MQQKLEFPCYWVSLIIKIFTVIYPELHATTSFVIRYTIDIDFSFTPNLQLLGILQKIYYDVRPKICPTFYDIYFAILYKRQNLAPCCILASLIFRMIFRYDINVLIYLLHMIYDCSLVSYDCNTIDLQAVLLINLNFLTWVNFLE